MIDQMRDLHAQKYGVAAESEEKRRSTLQGMNVGAGSCAVCWRGIDKVGTGSDGVALLDG